ncbi:WhiB family transcriptional regulator [Micrococcus flavus]|uniref:Transcriptional regulator WhiB n=1 Tax=Micrococcus flavus TaxID=384602 RepID=A0A4Y8X4M8_9MICC|nr:WhiB family transcriptional regulator [Micrococcus flavus]MBB4883316.1 WhiB family redox-sensing transcriptional regulator [Micrococcus flavus]TFI03688.1 WhiB family transcriptional regulator [Micrococcus flavus]GGK44104.1 hypothetical protein GCM10007073_08940 [Micrococcus flavus]
MQDTQRIEDAGHAERAQAAARSRAVPSDWFLDPADPAAGAWDASGSLEDRASALLAAHDLLDDDDDDAGTPGATVTELAPRREAARAEGAERWEPVPGVVMEPVEGELAWQVDALCAQTDPEAFFPEKGGSTRDAKRVCAACLVRQECLDYAMDNDERFGIWGGLSERERRRLRRERG